LGELGGNILVHINCMDITLAWKTSYKDVTTRVHRTLFFCFGLGGQLASPQMTPLYGYSYKASCARPC